VAQFESRTQIGAIDWYPILQEPVVWTANFWVASGIPAFLGDEDSEAFMESEAEVLLPLDMV
jgi:hypothetical protein